MTMLTDRDVINDLIDAWEMLNARGRRTTENGIDGERHSIPAIEYWLINDMAPRSRYF